LLQGYSSALKALEHDLKHLSLLRIHVRGFEVVNAKYAILELSDVFLEKVSASGVHASWSIRSFGMIEAIDIEARLGHIAFSRSACSEQVPELAWRG
jgi:hypothetical protein